MEMSATQAVKMMIVTATGLSKDALHVYIGLAVFVLAAVILRKRPSSILPWAVVLLAALLGETLDLYDDLASGGRWRWRASLHDIVNTMFWPTVLTMLARRGVFFKPEDRRGKV